MAHKIKVYWSDDEQAVSEEVDFKDAERFMAEAYAQGILVVDKREGIVIHEVSPEIEEILLIEETGGG
ncbi:hypothetical protein ACFLX4_00745 [Chloroflexota bacterium]